MGRAPRARSGSAKPRAGGMDLILASPAADDIIGLLRAWRFWLLGGMLGALLGAAAYSVSPPPYRARATVQVDFHLEQAWPQNTDREQFYYLERETRKLMDIAMSDATLRAVADNVPGVALEQMRAGMLQLSQPGSGGWHFYADHRDPDKAALLAGTWAQAFAEEARSAVLAGSAGGLEAFITVDVMQAESLRPSRTQSLGTYMLVAAGVALALGALAVLYLHPRR